MAKTIFSIDPANGRDKTAVLVAKIFKTRIKILDVFFGKTALRRALTKYPYVSTLIKEGE